MHHTSALWVLTDLFILVNRPFDRQPEKPDHDVSDDQGDDCADVVEEDSANPSNNDIRSELEEGSAGERQSVVMLLVGKKACEQIERVDQQCWCNDKCENTSKSADSSQGASSQHASKIDSVRTMEKIIYIIAKIALFVNKAMLCNEVCIKNEFS